jgi:hypothetical protein
MASSSSAWQKRPPPLSRYDVEGYGGEEEDEEEGLQVCLSVFLRG